MYCKRCGQVIPDSAAVCPFCGSLASGGAPGGERRRFPPAAGFHAFPGGDSPGGLDFAAGLGLQRQHQFLQTELGPGGPDLGDYAGGCLRRRGRRACGGQAGPPGIKRDGPAAGPEIREAEASLVLAPGISRLEMVSRRGGHIGPPLCCVPPIQCAVGRSPMGPILQFPFQGAII